MAAHQIRASKKKQKTVTRALVQAARHSIRVVSVSQALLLCAGVQGQGRREGRSAEDPHPHRSRTT